ncbi:branched-chain amino acid ABC transporter substrate-binding protein [Roseovarius atlanticus]|uniref:Branched-chain amino acid ABC transporter substrate-binding protein n=1 Tax=Roseovarius atlanticus TaxID=1641875 RepID=A0A0T5NQQ7_9RHOB|nr:ABC transporter substrate-binding protein [Roseovarius atlanticus]KRS11148.1 branched-chain amino acid ABC transporter substrate-binding protein [Roseovarius atlanticus]
MKQLTKALAVVSLVGGLITGAQASAEPFRVGVCYDLSKAYTFVTPQVSQAAMDLAKLINMQGGIGGKPVEVIVRDHANEPQRGIECYTRLTREGVFVFDTLSTPVSLAILPRVMQDENILMQSLVGRGDAVDGTVFEWVYPVGPTYWGQAANNIAYIKQLHDGDLSDVKVGYIYFDYPFGQEPIEILETLSEIEGFELLLYPVPLPGSDQSGAWSKMRRDKPDHVISWMLGGAHVVASKEMQRNRIPMEKYISVNWLNEVDIANIGAEAAAGLKRGTNVVGGQDIALRTEIISELYDNGEGSGPLVNTQDVYYNTGLAMYSIIFEAARRAAESEGLPITAQSYKSGLESLENYDANGLMAPITVTAEDHGGGGKTRIEMWDGETWVPQTDWIAEYSDVVWEVVKESSSKYKE